MADFALRGSAEPLDLGDGYSIEAGPLTGRVSTSPGRSQGARAIGDELDALLEAGGLTQQHVIAITPEPGAPGARDLVGGEAAVTINVPTPPGHGALVLMQDELGAVSWHFPETPVEAMQTPGVRALEPITVRFVVPLPRTVGAPGARGLGGIGGKILKVFVYPVVDAALGPIVRGFARKWEENNRPYLVRSYDQDNYKDDRKDFPALTGDQWTTLGAGRALLWVHGTFSSCGAFSAFVKEKIAALCGAYSGRSFAFNHFTLSADPLENAVDLLKRIPAGVNLDVDIVCHSRGGLVSREIARLGPTGAGGGTLRVGKIILVGVPNQGTALADDQHMTDMIDRFTTIAKVVPSATVQKIVEGLVLALKVIAHEILDDLPGLRSMNPHGPFLTAINTANGAAPEYFAIASNFDPPPGTALFSLVRVENGAADAVFEKVPNDLVVPRDGVFAANGANGFPVPDANVHEFDPNDGVIHTEYFSQGTTQDLIGQWLAQPPDTRALRSRLAAAPRSLSPGDLSALRPHVVDLSQGKFRKSGTYYTPPEDVDAIFEQHIPAWMNQRPDGEPLRLVFYAHGGLTSEEEGLGVAQKHVDWWKKNGVYPIYFVWETGLFDAIRSILQSAASRIPGLGARDLWDYTSDPLIEVGCRALGGVKVWGAMKANAQLASSAGGGALYVAKCLAAFCGRANGRPVELHALGHSAGSIFQGYFIPAAIKAGAPAFRTLQLLAPAVRVDEFKRQLLPLIGTDVGRLTMYTMLRHYEEADNCIGVYHKSLLYLIYNALEAEQDEPVLGLEMSTRGDADVKRLFGLDGSANPRADVVWSVTDASTGNSASRSTSHGGFDDDAATMSSAAARVLGVDAAPVPYAGTRALRSTGDWPISTEWLKPFDLTGVTPANGAASPPASVRPPAVAPSSAPSANVQKSSTQPSGGRRIALCVGIDAYPAPNTLTGCVNDATAWEQTLKGFGFTVSKLLDADATYKGITERLRALVTTAQAGDVLVFTYSGHGTNVPDTDGDEGGTDDQAFVPVDFGGGAFLIDDDVRAILLELPRGVDMTVFSDCCHSATNTRMLGWAPPPPPPGSKARLLVPTPAQIQAHLRYRADLRRRGLSRDLFDRTMMRWVNFAACQKQEYAYEADGHGAFTMHATTLLRGGLAGISNLVFQQRVVAAFGDGRAQTPYLDCSPTDERKPFLGGQTPPPAPQAAQRSLTGYSPFPEGGEPARL